MFNLITTHYSANRDNIAENKYDGLSIGVYFIDFRSINFNMKAMVSLIHAMLSLGGNQNVQLKKMLN